MRDTERGNFISVRPLHTISALVIWCFVAFGMAQSSTSSQRFVFMPNDRVRITSVDEAWLCTETVVGQDGTIFISGLGRVSLALRDSDVAKQNLQSMMRARGFRSSDILVEPIGSSAKEISITGAVSRSGNIAYFQSMSLAKILTVAEPTESSNLDRVELITARGEFRLVAIEEQATFQIKSGDRIFVPLRTGPNEVYIIGGIKRPGLVPFSTGLTLEKAIELAGGLSARGNRERVFLERFEGLSNRVSPANFAKTKLGPRDTIRVELIATVAYVTVNGMVKRPGLIEFFSGMTILQAIEEAGGFVPGASGTVNFWFRVNGTLRNKRFTLAQLAAGQIKIQALKDGDMIDVLMAVTKR